MRFHTKWLYSNLRLSGVCYLSNKNRNKANAMCINSELRHYFVIKIFKIEDCRIVILELKPL